MTFFNQGFTLRRKKKKLICQSFKWIKCYLTLYDFLVGVLKVLSSPTVFETVHEKSRIDKDSMIHVFQFHSFPAIDILNKTFSIQNNKL